MARINSYDLDTNISLNDYILGTDGDSNANVTKNFSVNGLFELFRNGIAATGGTFKISEALGDLGENLPETVINTMLLYTIAPYELVIVTCYNGSKYIFKKNNGAYGSGGLQSVYSDFVKIYEIDDVPTDGSTKLVNSNGIFDAILEAKKEYIVIPINSIIENVTTGTTKAYFRMPFSGTLLEVRGSLIVAQTAGSLLTVDVNKDGTSVLSTKLTFDNTEKTTTTAAIPYIISNSVLTNDSEITFDVDQVGTAGAKGLEITLVIIRA
jgi:hypothetical protein